MLVASLFKMLMRMGLCEAHLAFALIGSACLHVGVVIASSYFVPAAKAPEPLLLAEFEVEVQAATPEPEPEPILEPEPEPAVEPPKPKPKAIVKKPDPASKEEEPVKAKSLAEQEVPQSAVAAGPTVSPEQALPGACSEGVCLPTGPGGGIGKVGSTGTARSGAAEMVAAREPTPKAAETSLGRPLHRVRPSYPVRAAEHNIEGWVLLRFSVGKGGEVLEAEVVESEPSRIFNAAALEAIKLWKYKPMLVSGVPTVREGVLVRLSFKLD